MPLKLLKDVTLTSLISDKSAFGVVYKTTNPKLVVKLQIVGSPTSSLSNNFVDEGLIGTQVNPKYATKVRRVKIISPQNNPEMHRKILKYVKKYRKDKTLTKKYIGILVIDNIVQSKLHTSLSLSDFFSKLKKDYLCPTKEHRIYRLLKKCLIEFYKIGYYHGDLHLKNIHVVVEKKNPSHIVTVKIIDYGMSLPFKTSKPTKCLKSILEDISNTFLINKIKGKRMWLKNNKKRVKFITNLLGAPINFITNAKNISINNSNLKSSIYNKQYKYPSRSNPFTNTVTS